jgi:hypothetical protein|tara:strand:+ start:1439 stop:1561 length:123 start_codon:yes stop_codon:yes gene_type:complete
MVLRDPLHLKMTPDVASGIYVRHIEADYDVGFNSLDQPSR